MLRLAPVPGQARPRPTVLYLAPVKESSSDTFRRSLNVAGLSLYRASMKSGLSLPRLSAIEVPEYASRSRWSSMCSIDQSSVVPSPVVMVA